MSINNMHNLVTLVKRLEAATSRLEDMAMSTLEVPKTNGTAPSSASGSEASAPPAVQAAAPPAPPPPAAPPAPKQDPIPESVKDFDAFIDGTVKKYAGNSQQLGGAVAVQAADVLKAFQAQRTFLLITTKSKKPDYASEEFANLLKPLQEGMIAVNKIRDDNRGKPQFNQLSTVSEGILLLAWVTIGAKPHKHVEEQLGSAQYWGNRVLKEFKETDPKQVAWVQSYYQIFKDLSQYIQDTFPQGLIWNPSGVSCKEAAAAVATSSSASSSGPPPPPAAGGAPPPPPPGPPPNLALLESAAPKAAAPAGGIEAVFNELNKGEAVTKGLRKVKPDEMTHKNPSLRAGATVPTRSDSMESMRGKSPAPPGKKPKPETLRTKKPPRKELDGNKWIIENFDNESQPIEIEASITHSILISRCNKTTIMVKGKANAISVDNSPRLSLVIESLVSSVDVIKSSNFALQVLGTLPTVLMDQVDGAQVYLGKQSMGTEVFASKCSGVNLNVMDGSGEDADYRECPLPEQIRTYIGEGGKVISEIVEHAG